MSAPMPSVPPAVRPPFSSQQRGPVGRTIIVSNRLPFTARVTESGITLQRSSGGLATALGDVFDGANGRWVGWAGLGSGVPDAQRRIARERLRARGAVPVDLTDLEIDGYYRRYANGILWPMLHGMVPPAPTDRYGFADYRRVNERFADVLAAELQPGDRVWVHDYHLMLLPALLRERSRGIRIGFFLHTPMPPVEILDDLPDFRELLEGLLGADVIAVHTASYVDNMQAALARFAGPRKFVRTARVEQREVAVHGAPIGVDASGFARRATRPDVLLYADEIRRRGRPLFVGIDRLDYTKGIPQRLAAFEELLARDASLRGRARLVQIGVPSREEASGYRATRHEIERIVERVNTRFGTPSWQPIAFTYANLDQLELAALYRAADVMLVTPLRDGMNLVAKEFAASRVDDDGVLVLGRGAGAADELRAAVLVDASDPEALVASYRQALAMPEAERRVRMRHLRSVVARADVHRWVARLESLLDDAGRGLALEGRAVPKAGVPIAFR